MNLDQAHPQQRNLDSSDKGPKKFNGGKYGDCATVEIDEENNVKTVTFSGDCKGKRGQSRSGTMIISYLTSAMRLVVSVK